ncbi:MAG: Gfo/Idh/MocA family oxidoreductase, partial [Alphaproteobacteria bacterium]|nr:Gfo/Idh/MocA family oxidoreductase [Alphaproteobacteria bacterium]
MTSILLVGLGRWGANHLRTLRSLPVTLYCADTDPARLEAAIKGGVAAERCGRDALAFLPKVDGVVIATPAQDHFDLARRCLDAGKDVLVEKPLTVTGAESKQLTEVALKKGRILQVGHIFLYDPASLWLRDAVADGTFGRMKLLRGHFGGFKRPRSDGGVSFADAIHFSALFDFILGKRPKRVTGHLADFFGRGMDDQSLIVLDYELPTGRVMAQIETGYHVPGKFREVTVTGDKLSAVCDFNIAQYKIKTFEARHEPAKNGEIAAIEGAMKQLEFPPSEPLLE